VVADNGLRSFLSNFREPPKDNRISGNCFVFFTRDIREHVVEKYDPMQGVSALYNETKFINEMIVSKTLNMAIVPSKDHHDPTFILVAMEGRDMVASPPKEGIVTVKKISSYPSQEQVRHGGSLSSYCCLLAHCLFHHSWERINPTSIVTPSHAI
jgi:hypothetical protein